MNGKFLFFYCLLFFFAANNCVFAQQLAPSIVWQKCLGGSGSDQANSIVRTPDGGFVIAGWSNSNDGDVTGNHNGSKDGWIVKISSIGAIQWQRSVGGTGADEFNTVIRLADGNFLCMGTTSSIDGDVTGNHGGGDLWLVKISAYGGLIWSKSYGGSSTEYVGNVTENQDGSFYMTGSTMSFDGDVTGRRGTDIYDQDIWVVKLKNDGSMIWEGCYGGTGLDNGYDIHEADNGSFLLAMRSEGIDGDFGDVSGLSPRGSIAKIDSNKNVVWIMKGLQGSKPIAMIPGGDGYDVNTDAVGCAPMLNNSAANQWHFAYDPSQSVAAVPTLIEQYSYCPGGTNPIYRQGYKTVGSAGIARASETNLIFAGSSDDSITHPGFHGGQFDGFIGLDKTNSNPPITKFLGGSLDDEFTSVVSIDPNNFIAAGYTYSNDGDVSGNHGGGDVWVVKMGNVNTIKGLVYQDYNRNNVKDANEPLVNNIIVQSQKGLSKSASSTYNGIFENSVDTGTYITSVLSNVLYYTPSPASISTSFSNYSLSDSISIALQPITGKRDYAVNFLNYSQVRPGFPAQYRIFLTNKGTDTLTNKQVSLAVDSRMQFVSSIPTQTSISGDTINWTIAHLDPRDTISVLVMLQASPPPVLNIGDTLVFSAVIDSTGDLNSIDNVAALSEWVSGAYDPNAIEEVHAGSIPLQEVTQGSDLLYTIHFQNTGNDTAFTVVVRDTLETRIMASSVEMVDASHAYRLTIQDSSILVWTFENILLPDSIHNEPKSHGYISFRVKPGSDLAVGDIIKNTSSVYFDFNPPVQTNTEITIVTKDLPALPTPKLSKLDSFFCLSSANQQVKILNLPPASQGITVLVQLDTVHNLPVYADSSFTIVPSGMNAGNHSVKVTYTDLTSQSKSTSLFFTILGETNADLTLSASQTVIGRGTDSVTVIATGQVSNGQTPLYTFAKDRLFNNIIQQQSAVNRLVLPASALSPGDNMIFVKLNTAPFHCQILQPVIDSIQITRRNFTGLIDLDFPDEPINIFPNPFDTHLTISGLQTDKQYACIIYNSTGQKLVNKSIVHQNLYSTDIPFLAKAVYVLWLYDVTRDRLIGTVSMIKQ